MKKLLIITLILLLTTNAYSAVIFSDNFDGYTWQCTGADHQMAAWTKVPGTCVNDTYGGVTHYCTDVSAATGRTGNSFKSWKHGTFDLGFTGIPGYYFTSSYKEIYVRWYMKIPSAFATTGAMNYLKLWRIDFGSEYLYLNFNSSTTFANAALEIGDTTSAWKTLLSSVPHDDAWHCYEIRARLSTTGTTDGHLQFWYDGVLTYNPTDTHVKWASATADNFLFTEVGIGNTAATSYQPSWQAIEFDDYVVSTTYIGPIAGGEKTLTSITVTPDATSVLLGFTQQMTATALYSDASTEDVTAQCAWTSSNAGIASVGAATGIVTCNAGGTVTITATFPTGPTVDTTSFTVTLPPSDPVTILSETWESGSTSNWQCDYIAGDTVIASSPVYAGTKAIKMYSSSPGNYVKCFGDNALLGAGAGAMVTDVTVEEYYRPSTGFLWPTGAMKLWIMNCFHSWGAPYPLAAGQSKPHTWAPYYITIAADPTGIVFGQLVRSDGLGGAGVLWEDYHQNTGSPIAISTTDWTKIKFRVKLNTLGLSDGILQIWVNNVLQVNYTTMNFRGTYATYGWNHLMMSMDPYPDYPQAEQISRDNIWIYKTGSAADPVTTVPTIGIGGFRTW